MRVPPSARASRWIMTSVSEVDWNTAPSCSRLRRSSSALTRLPLWARGAMPGRALEPVAAEHVRHPAHRLLHMEAVAVRGGDARGLLPAVLQRVEAEIGDVGGLGMVPHAEEPALVVELVAVELGRLSPDVAQARSSTHGPAAPRPRPAPPAPRGGSPAPPPAPHP